MKVILRRTDVRILAIATACVVVALLAFFALARRPRSAVRPDGDSIFTSTRYVTALAVAEDGKLWVGTMGGVLRCDMSGGISTKFTRLDGLPSHEVRGLLCEDALTAVFPQASANWTDGRRWVPGPIPRALPSVGPFEQQTCAAVWREAPCVATVEGLHVREGDAWRSVALPESTGSHISALLPHGDGLWAAMFGDGIWEFDGESWQRAGLNLPRQAREITALESNGRDLWVGTRREGVWQYDGRRWRQHLQPDEPYDHNCHALAIYRGSLYMSTLEDGLVVRTRQGWRHYGAPTISSNSPRQMVQFGGSVYLRHGSGKVDRFDGKQWTLDVCASLPRKEATALAADRRRLFVGQWGGWSEFDGRRWTHHLKLPDLQGLPVTGLLPEGDTLWVATQSRGLAEVSRPTGKLRWHDERHLLPDDWVTCLARVGRALYVGTFSGGLARWDGNAWTTIAALTGEEVTALTPDGAGGLFVATRKGVWYRTRGGKLEQINDRVGFVGPEAQALCADGGGLWVGTRTGLYFLTKHTLQR